MTTPLTEVARTSCMPYFQLQEVQSYHLPGSGEKRKYLVNSVYHVCSANCLWHRPRSSTVLLVGALRVPAWGSLSPPLLNTVLASSALSPRLLVSPPLPSLPSSPLGPIVSSLCSSPGVLGSSPALPLTHCAGRAGVRPFSSSGSQFAHLYSGTLPLNLPLPPQCLLWDAFLEASVC